MQENDGRNPYAQENSNDTYSRYRDWNDEDDFFDDEDGISAEDRKMAMYAHFGPLLWPFVVTLIIWVVNKNNSKFVEDQCREAMNFQISVAIISFVCFMTIVGILLIPFLLLFGTVMPIIAGVKANKGERYRYPMTIRLLS